MDESTLKNYTKRVETLRLPWLTPLAVSLGYSLRDGKLRDPPPALGAVKKPPAMGLLIGWRKVRRTTWVDRNSGHTYVEDSRPPDQAPDGSYKTNPTS